MSTALPRPADFGTTTARPHAAGAAAGSLGDFARRWMLAAVVYLMVGVSLGLYMGVSQDHSLRAVHVHVNLLGWATMVLTGVIYHFFRKAAASRLARVHFWLYQVALPLDMINLALMFKGHAGVMPFLAVTTLSVVLAVVLFVTNVLWHRG